MKPIFVVIFVAFASSSIAVAANYRVRESKAGSTELFVTLNLSDKRGEPKRLVTRAASLGLKSQIHSPRCANALLRQHPDGGWSVPVSCDKVAWTVRAKLGVEGTVDVSTQATVKFVNPAWFLLSESTSLLKLADDDRASTIAFQGRTKGSSAIGATEISSGVWRVPSFNNAPEFFAFGQLPSSTRNVGKFAITYVADKSANVARLGLETMHEKALGFLAKVVAPPAVSPPVERTLLVIWVGVHEHLGHAGGAAGSRSFVANYIVGKPENEEINAARTMAVLAHEQFHQLADLARGPLPPLPTWLNESLAHYYALKAMKIAAVSSDASNSVYSRFVDPRRPVTLGLLELNRRYAANDRSVYPLFYEQGATFWSELDLAILHATRGASSLDELVPELLRSATTYDDRLPLSFVISMRERIGATADDLLLKYVGD